MKTKIKVYGKEREELKKIIKKKYSKYFSIIKKENKKKPDLVFCYGGDGTLLLAEREQPGIPKVSIRNSQICNACRNKTRDGILKLISKGKYYFNKHYKIEAHFKNKKVVALNDIIIAHRNINTALRFRVFVSGLPYGCEFLGDGIVAATSIGSTAYYQAITRSNFQEGIGIAFNNVVNAIGHIVLNDKAKIRILITRGPGIMRYDNHKSKISVKTGEEIFIQRSKELANLINFFTPYRSFNIDISKNRLPLGYCQTCSRYYKNMENHQGLQGCNRS